MSYIKKTRVDPLSLVEAARAGALPRRRYDRYRLMLPYGVWQTADGTEFLFNRKYEPIVGRTLDGQLVWVAPDTRIPFVGQSWFYKEHEPWRHPEVARRLAEHLDGFWRGT